MFATIGVLLVSYAFIRLSRYFSHAGSVYAFSGVDARAARRLLRRLGAAGHIHVLHGGLNSGGRNCSAIAFFKEADIIPASTTWLIALVAAVLIAVLAYGDIRVATRSLLGMEGISVTLIVIAMIVIVVKLIAGTAPGNQSITVDAFKLPPRHVVLRRGQRLGVRLPVVRGV